MKMRRCNTREPTLLSAMVEEEGNGCGDGKILVCVLSATLSLFSVGRQRHRQQRHVAAVCTSSADGRDLQAELMREGGVGRAAG